VADDDTQEQTGARATGPGNSKPASGADNPRALGNDGGQGEGQDDGEETRDDGGGAAVATDEGDGSRRSDDDGDATDDEQAQTSSGQNGHGADGTGPKTGRVEEVQGVVIEVVFPRTPCPS
jgi:hypothetical protein